MAIFNSYVKLPEGSYHSKLNSFQLVASVRTGEHPPFLVVRTHKIPHAELQVRK